MWGCIWANFALYGKENDQINVMQGRDYNPLFYENCIQPFINPVVDNFKEVFRLPVYDEYEADYWDVMPKNPGLDFVSPGLDKEGNESAKITVSPYFSNLKISRQGEVFCLLYPVGENECVFVEACIKDEALNS